MEVSFREHFKAYRTKVVKYILKKNNCKVLKTLGTGGFSDVLAVEDRKNENFAVKIIDENSANIEEIRLWPYLKHPNIEPLFNIFEFRGIFIFTMPIQDFTLKTIVQDQEFLKQPDAYSKVQTWFKDVLKGLSYLQFHKLSHLDIKATNILISKEHRAIISDFTCLSRSAEPVISHGCPFHLRPPEACHSEGQIIPVEGCYYDSWTTGLMFLECITKDVFAKSLSQSRMPEEIFWTRDMYEVLFNILPEHNFYTCVSETFPSTAFNIADLEVVRNFILMFLQFKPEKRPTAKTALTHKIFNRRTGNMFKGDHIWKKKVEISWINDFISKYFHELLLKTFPKNCKCRMCVKTRSVEFDHIISVDED